MEKFWNFLLGAFIGVAGAAITGSAIVASLGTLLVVLWFAAKCVLLDRPDSETLTISHLMRQLERVTANQIDRAILASIEARATDLLQIIEHEKENLERIDELSASERQRVSIVMQTLANQASQLEAELRNLPWQALPAVGFVAALKLGAYALASGLAEVSAYRRNVVARVIPVERMESIALIARMEAQMVQFVRTKLTTVRQSSKRTSTGAVPTTWFEITAKATRDDELVVDRHWECERRWRPRQECTNFETRRAQYFDEALTAHRNMRSANARALTPEYLAMRNELMMFRGAEFFLLNNRVGDATRLQAGRGRCTDVAGDPATASGQYLLTRDCDAHDDLASGQTWRFRSGSGQLRNTLHGGCMDVAGTPGTQVDGSLVGLTACSVDSDSPAYADQQWGVHPLGYIVHLATGRCLDVQGSAAPAAGALARVTACRYDLDAGVVNAYGDPARGASIGTRSSDTLTNQTWALWYRGRPVPTTVPAAPPIEVFDVPPFAVDDTATVRQDAGPATVEVLSNDIDPDGGAMNVAEVTQPAHGEVAIVPGSGDRADTVQYTPTARYCNTRGDQLADTFTYRSNGEGTATVHMTVTCFGIPEPPSEVAVTVLSPASARVSFVAPEFDGGASINSYRVQCFSPDGGTTRVKDGGSSPIIFTTLSAARTYKCRVRATNEVGHGLYSVFSEAFQLPAGVPDRPVAIEVEPASFTTASVTFAAPQDNGSEIVAYKAQCASSDGGVTGYGNGITTPVIARRLSPGQSYRCRVQAVNDVGGSVWSAFSTPVALPAS